MMAPPGLAVDFESDHTEDREAPANALIERLGHAGVHSRKLRWLVRRRRTFPDLAPLMWETDGFIQMLCLYVRDVMPHLAEVDGLSVARVNRACEALAMFQCLAAHPSTARSFTDHGFLTQLFPIIASPAQDERMDCLRATALGVFAALIKSKNVNALSAQSQLTLETTCMKLGEYGSTPTDHAVTYILRKLRKRSAQADQQGTSSVAGARHTGDLAFQANHIIWGEVDSAVALCRNQNDFWTESSNTSAESGKRRATGTYAL